MKRLVSVSYQEMFEAYHEAVDCGATMDTVINYKGMEFLMGYLKYLLRYMKTKAEEAGTVNDPIFTFIPKEER